MKKIKTESRQTERCLTWDTGEVVVPVETKSEGGGAYLEGVGNHLEISNWRYLWEIWRCLIANWVHVSGVGARDTYI